MRRLIAEFLKALKRRNDTNNSYDIVFFVQINGGYESWLQLELANFFRNYDLYYSREITKINEININFGGGQKIDMVLGHDFIYDLIEIKCQSINQECDQVALGFWKDVLKLYSIQDSEYIRKYAIAFVNLSAYQNIACIIHSFNNVKNALVRCGRNSLSGFGTGRELSEEEKNKLQQIQVNDGNIVSIQFENIIECCQGMGAVVFDLNVLNNVDARTLLL